MSLPGRKRKGGKDRPTLKQFIDNRDYIGAITLIEFDKKQAKGAAAAPTSDEGGEKEKQKHIENPELWQAYCHFHLGEYKQAAQVYKDLISSASPDDTGVGLLHTCLACCFFHMGLHKEAEEEANKNPDDTLPLQNRLLFHIAHRLNDEQNLMKYHALLQENLVVDQLSLASIHFLRSHNQEAIDVYKRILMENRDYLALNVYVALCYYKLDYYDVAHELLTVYLASHPDSALAINLKACTHFRLYTNKAGELEIKRLVDMTSSSTGHTYASDLVKHNMVVFRNGENALQVLPPLLRTIPEAQLNLVIYYLKNDEVDEAFQIIKDLEPTTTQEYTLKGVVYAAYGQRHDSREHLKLAQGAFQLVGASPLECDTIPGRQCMASCFFLLHQFEDVLIYLNSIRSYFTDDDDFNWNFGIAKAMEGDWKGAEEALSLIRNESYLNEYAHLAWLSRCYIMNGKAGAAWELYVQANATPESLTLLELIANDCYKQGAFYYAAKAFHMLERLAPDQISDYWKGKRGACIGVFQQVIAGEEVKESLREIINMLHTPNSVEVDAIIKAIRRWGKENGM